MGEFIALHGIRTRKSEVVAYYALTMKDYKSSNAYSLFLMTSPSLRNEGYVVCLELRGQPAPRIYLADTEAEVEDVMAALDKHLGADLCYPPRKADAP